MPRLAELRWRELARNRLVHFLVLGAGLFAVAPRERDDRDRTIAAARVDAALRSEQARKGRGLHGAEEAQAIAALIDEEVLASEALRLGIGTDDPLVRARLAERMQAALTSALPAVDVTEEELAAEIAQRLSHAEERVRLGVHFFHKDRKDRVDAARAAELGVNGGAAPASDRAPIPDGVWWTEASLTRAAGHAVAEAAMRTPVGRPSAPTASAWGLWVVVPLERRRAEPSEVRTEAEAAVRERKQAEALARVLEQKRRDYRIEVKKPQGDVVSRGAE